MYDAGGYEYLNTLDALDIVGNTIEVNFGPKAAVVASLLPIGMSSGRLLRALTTHPNWHRSIKKTILSQAGDYKSVVGKNPDIDINDIGEVILKGRDKFKGKTFNTHNAGHSYLED